MVSFGEGAHQPKSVDCLRCWSGFPQPHKGCTGLLHAEFEDESFDGYFLSYRCDACDETEEPA